MLLLFLLISAMPLVRHPLWEHFVSDLTAIKYLGLGCLACALAHCLLTRRTPALAGSVQALAMAALCLWAIMSGVFWGAPIAWAQSPALSYASFLMLLVIALGLLDSWKRLGHVLWAMIAAVAIASLYVVREWQEFHLMYVHFRPGWVTGDPNYFTVSALVGLPLALVFCGRSQSWWKRMVARGSALLTLAAVALAASRGGLLGLGAMGAWIAWQKRRLGVFLLLGALVTPPLLLWPRSPLNRLMHPSVSDIKSSNTRLALWQAGMAMVEAHPLRGIGLGQFKSEVEEYAVGHQDLDHIAHNSYLALASELGLPALAAYLLILGGALYTLVRFRRRALDDTAGALPPWAADAALGLQAGLVGFSVSAFFLSAQYTKLLWFLLAVSAAVEGLLAAPAPEPVRQQELSAPPDGELGQEAPLRGAWADIQPGGVGLALPELVPHV